MSEESAEKTDEAKAAQTQELAGKLQSVGWALLLIWIGTVLITRMGRGVSMWGVGVIFLGVQLVRICRRLRLESFWVVIGLLFILAGVGEVLDTALPLGAILLVVAGVGLLISALRGKPLMRK